MKLVGEGESEAAEKGERRGWRQEERSKLSRRREKGSRHGNEKWSRPQEAKSATGSEVEAARKEGKGKSATGSEVERKPPRSDKKKSRREEEKLELPRSKEREVGKRKSEDRSYQRRRARLEAGKKG